MNTKIRPGQLWLDTEGKRIEAHGGALFYNREADTYYWYGENKDHTDGKSKVWTWGVKYYSSKDLYNWKNDGFLLEAQPDDPNSPLFPENRLDRPHIIFSKATGKYVCWLKFSGERACFAVFAADQFSGPYTLMRDRFRPLGKKVGDFDIVEEDGTGKYYLFFDSDHAGITSIELTPDCCDVRGEAKTHFGGRHPPFVREAPALFHRQARYYMLTSGMTGYLPNPSESAVAESLQGPFSVQGELHVDDDTCSSFSSQISCVFRHPKKKDLYIAMADRWVPDYKVTRETYESVVQVIAGHSEPGKYHPTQEDKENLMKSPMLKSANTSLATYVWLPLRFDGERARINWFDSWKVEDYK